MLDVTYEGSPLVGEHLGPGTEPPPAPGPGERYPGRTALTGTGHHLLLFGAADDAGVERLRRRWRGLVEVVRATGDTPPAGLTSAGAVLVRPDGHIGFRAAPADTAGLAAVDAHLDSYLVPAQA
jgi:6-methylpretetramide 4-monooxygenase / 4-hydroxy-6-methylpretetramide 12a-monooxygenase